ncbi:MAG: M24 family metallopeptidase [Patescibacteria group bacterium]
MNNSQLQAIKQAVPVIKQAFLFIKQQLTVGISEKDLEQALTAYLKKAGFSQLAFKHIIAFGFNAYFPHHKPANKKLAINEMVLIDFGIKVNGWCTDITRTFYHGQPDKRFKKIYTTVLKAQQAAINKLKTNRYSKTIDQAARNIINQAGYKKAFRHNTGHGLGRKIHQPPYLSSKIKRGVILTDGELVTIEPGIYLKDWGGVRIEDMVTVARSPQILSKIIPKKYSDILVRN